MLILITACTFGTVALFVVGITMRSERAIARERIQRHAETGAVTTSSVEVEMSTPLLERIVLPFLRSLADLVHNLTPKGVAEVIDDKLETAGRPWRMGAKEFIGLRVICLVIFIVLGLGTARIIALPPLMNMLMLGLIIFIGYVLPDYLLQMRINERQSKVRKVLPDTLDLLTVSVQAGIGLDGAMSKVTEKLRSPLSEEMARALQEMRVGRLRADALKAMAKRVKVNELTAFVAAICQADQLGVSISRVLQVQSEMLRSQRSQRARETASKLPVKMLFPLVFCIFPALFVAVLAPGAIQIARALGILK
jgi:tight adherence protein C